jgi:UV DNA damage endonuclease
MDAPAPFRLGFAVKVLGAGGLRSHDARRHASGPHLSRSLELLDAVFDYLDREDIRVYRMSSSTVPYGTHPDLPHLDYRRQIDECAEVLARLGAKARAYGLRLSTHPGQYTVINAPDPELVRKSCLDLEQDAFLLDALGQPREAVVVVHVGGAYGEPRAALDRWAAAYESLSPRARARVVVEHDETSFALADVLELHRRTGVRVIYDAHHDRCNPSDATVADALATWPDDVRPKVHLSSPKLDFRENGAAPTLDQHSDFVSPWDAAALVRSLPRAADVVLEAKAKDLALLRLRAQLPRVDAAVAAAEQRTTPSGRAAPRRARAATSTARTRAGS